MTVDHLPLTKQKKNRITLPLATIDFKLKLQLKREHSDSECDGWMVAYSSGGSVFYFRIGHI